MLIPDQTKLIDLGNRTPRVYSGQQLNKFITVVANSVRNLNYPKGTRIGVIGVNSIFTVATILGIQETDNIVVPVNYRLPQGQISACLADCKIVFCDAEFKDLVSGIPAVVFGPEFNKLLDYTEQEPVELDEDRIVLSLHTSGSTGQPKRVDFRYRDRRCAITPGYPTRTMSPNPFFHAAGLNWLKYNLVGGNHVFIAPKFDAVDFGNTIERYKIEHLFMVTPTALFLLRDSTADFGSVTKITLPSAPVSIGALSKIRARFGNLKELHSSYGLTESGIQIFDLHPTASTPDGSVGIPTKFGVKLVDGVLHVRSADLKSAVKVDSEYLNTNDRFRVDANGFYYYQGRADDMFKVNGEKVYPKDIEEVLVGYPGVDMAVVVSQPDEVVGHCAYAFISSRVNISQADLRAYCAERLASHQMPKQFILLETLPVLGSGKFDLTTLKKHITL